MNTQTAVKLNHTALPWVRDYSHKHEWPGIAIWSGDVVIAHVLADQHGQEEANSDLILRSVNSAPALVEALLKIERACLLAFNSDEVLCPSQIGNICAETLRSAGIQD